MGRRSQGFMASLAMTYTVQHRTGVSTCVSTLASPAPLHPHTTGPGSSCDVPGEAHRWLLLER